MQHDPDRFPDFVDRLSRRKERRKWRFVASVSHGMAEIVLNFIFRHTFFLKKNRRAPREKTANARAGCISKTSSSRASGYARASSQLREVEK